MITRRGILAASMLGLPRLLYAKEARSERVIAALVNLERNNGGLLGVTVIDTGSSTRVDHRGEERFPMCSTFKFLLASAVLQRIDAGHESLDRAVPIPGKPFLFNSPLTEPNAGGKMSVAALCQAALTRSDNTAANLLLNTLGGPQGITKFCRTLGDNSTRLDRMELDLNESLEGDPRDTTTPSAMANDLRSILVGNVLSANSRALMTSWMESNVTGLDRLRADLPANWRVADKTGANGEHTSNDIAVIWPPGRSPVIVTAYITQCFGPEGKRAAMLAHIGGLVRNWLA